MIDWSFVYTGSALIWEIIPLTLGYTLLLHCIGVIAMIVIILIKLVGQSSELVDELCLNFARALLRKTTEATNLAFLHTSNLIFSCTWKQLKVCHWMGSVKFRGSFYGSKKTSKQEKQKMVNSFAVQQHRIIITWSVRIWSMTVQPTTVSFQSVSFLLIYKNIRSFGQCGSKLGCRVKVRAFYGLRSGQGCVEKLWQAKKNWHNVTNIFG